MPGYAWDPVVRIVPRNGAEKVVVFANAFSDLTGHERADVRYVPEMRARRDVNRSERPGLYGWRPEVRFDLAIQTMADQHNLAQIQDALMSPSVDVYLAMDAVTFRRVVLASDDGPDPIAGKVFVGARFRLAVRCADLLTDRPRMGLTGGPFQREWLMNGGFEVWSGGQPYSWGYFATAGGTITQDTINNRSGTSCIAFARTSGGTLENGNQQIYGLNPGQWYTVSTWGKASTSITNGHKIYLRAEDRAQMNITSDGVTWSGNLGLPAIQFNLTGIYQQRSLTFRVKSDFLKNDRYAIYHVCDNIGIGQTWYVDDVSIVGPVLPSGVSLW